MAWLRKEEELFHHGILGQKWGKKNGPPYPLGSDKSTGKRLKTTFVSGSSKTQDKSSPYYQRKLPKSIREELKKEMKSGNKIIVGDAPGIDRQVQDYLKKRKYKNVEVYSPGKEPRYLANKTWKNRLIDDPDHEPMSPEWLAKKDKAMSKVADKGIAVILDKGSGATKNNINRLTSKGKEVSIYQLYSKDANYKDVLFNDPYNSNDKINKLQNKRYKLSNKIEDLTLTGKKANQEEIDSLTNELSKINKEIETLSAPYGNRNKIYSNKINRDLKKYERQRKIW